MTTSLTRRLLGGMLVLVVSGVAELAWVAGFRKEHN